MASTKTKIVAAAVIWIGVSILGYRAYQSFAAHMGWNRRSSQRQQWAQTQQQRDQLRRDMDKFFESKPVTEFQIKVKRSKTPDARMVGDRVREKTFYLFGTGESIAGIYARLKGAENWRISQIPKDSGRWDIQIKAPTRMRDQLAQYFLAYMKWDTKQKNQLTSGYHVVEGAGVPEQPKNAPPPQQQQGRRQRGQRGQMPDIALQNIAGFLQQQLRVPVKVDRPLRDRKPGPAASTVQWNWGGKPEDMISAISTAYGVNVKKEDVGTTLTLVYHPKYANRVEMDQWSYQAEPTK